MCDSHKKFAREVNNYSKLDAMIEQNHSMEAFIQETLASYKPPLKKKAQQKLTLSTGLER